MIRFFVFFISLVSILVFPETTASYPILKFFLMLGIVIPMLSWILQLYSNIPESNAGVIPLSDRFAKMFSYVATKRQAKIMDISQDIAIKIKKKTNVKINHWRSKVEKFHYNKIITQLNTDSVNDCIQ